MAAEFGSSLVLPMDVASDAEIDTAFAQLRERWDSLDILVHSVAFAPREQLAGGYLDSVTREGFQIAHDISSYSLAALAKAARPMMPGRAGRDPDADLPRRGALDPELQRDGPGQGEPRGERALPGGRPRPAGHPRERDLRRPDQDAGRGRRQRLPQDARATSRRTRRCGATSRSTRSATPRRSCARTWPPASPARSLYVDAGYSHVGMAFPEDDKSD